MHGISNCFEDELPRDFREFEMILMRHQNLTYAVSKGRLTSYKTVRHLEVNSNQEQLKNRKNLKKSEKSQNSSDENFWNSDSCCLLGRFDSEKSK